MTLDELLSRLEKVKKVSGGFEARCPAHADSTASLGVKEGDKGIVLLCRAGCDTGDVMAAMGLKLADLFYEEREPPRDEIEAVYDYKDADGKLVFQVVRKRKPDGRKTFTQRHPDGAGDWIYTMDGVERTLYRLPELLEGIRAGRRILIPEGEKDVDAIYKVGGVATCNSGGSNSWRDSYADLLVGAAEAWIVADKDKAGRAHADRIAESLKARGIPHFIVEALEGKDPHDHIEAGHGLSELVHVNLAELELEDDGTDGLVLVRSSTVETRDVDWVDGYENMLAYGALSGLFGMPESNKSTLICQVAAQITRGGAAALIIGSEDSPEMVVKPRLWATGANLDLCYFPAIRRNGLEGDLVFPSNTEELDYAIEKTGAKFVSIDPVAAHLDSNVDSNDDQSIRSALTPLARIAERRRCVILVVKHFNKTRSTDPMIRSGGSIGLPGICRTCLLMGPHPDDRDDEGLRLLASFKNSWGPKPTTRQYRVTSVPVPGMTEPSIKLEDWGVSYHKAWQLLTERKGAPTT